MFGISFTKLVVLVAIIAIVWYGFKYLGRLQAMEQGERKKGTRTMGERLRKATKEKTGFQDAEIIEDTERCPRCGTFIPVGTECNCKK